MSRRRWLSTAGPGLARFGRWLLRAVLQDSVLWFLKSKLTPLVLGGLGVVGAWVGGASVVGEAKRVVPGPPAHEARTELARRAVPRDPESPPPRVTAPSPASPRGTTASPGFTSYHLTCEDEHGRTGRFDLVIFSRAFSWALSQDAEVELNSRPHDLLAHLKSPGMARYLHAPEVIAVGMASCEGYPEHREREIARARARAEQLGVWIAEVREPRTERRSHLPIRTLSLGVFAEPCTTEETWWQRRVVLLALYEIDSRLSLCDCLESALLQEPNLNHLVTRYDPGLHPGRLFCRSGR